MITLLQIKRAVFGKLETSFPDWQLYGETVTGGFKRPSLFILLVPLDANQQSKYLIRKRLMVDIAGFPEEESAEGNLVLLDALQAAVGFSLPVEDRVFELRNVRSRVVDEVVHCLFELDYLDGPPLEEGYTTESELVLADIEQ